MANQTSSIDEILANAVANNQPAKAPPIQQASESEDDPRETIVESANLEKPLESSGESDEYGLNSEPEKSSTDDVPKEEKSVLETDEYGNEKAASRTYTQEEADEYANRIVRERLARLEKNNAALLTPAQTQQAQQQVAQGFEYDSGSQETWEQQLEKFVEKTYYKIGQRQAQQTQQMKEQQLRAEFEERFYQGANKFKDFRETVMSLGVPIPDTITEATRAMKDPAAFIYAAVKRAPEKLKEIARMEDPYAQVLALGKLEENMKKTKQTTKTPKPVGRTQEDSQLPASKPKAEPTIEQMIAQADAKRRALNEQRRRR